MFTFPQPYRLADRSDANRMNVGVRNCRIGKVTPKAPSIYGRWEDVKRIYPVFRHPAQRTQDVPPVAFRTWSE